MVKLGIRSRHGVAPRFQESAIPLALILTLACAGPASSAFAVAPTGQGEQWRALVSRANAPDSPVGKHHLRRPAAAKALAQPNAVTVVVDRADDSALLADQACTAALNDCTFRGAILMANATPGADAIQFAIPGTGPFTIIPSGPLPDITEDVQIQGYTQSGAVVNSDPFGSNAVLQIVLNGQGLVVAAPNTVIEGLVIQNVPTYGIRVTAAGSGLVSGSFIGTDVSGNTAVPNGTGVFLDRDGAFNGVFAVGSADVPDAYRNIISGNLDAAVDIVGDEWAVANNLIGTDASGSAALGNGNGVSVAGLCSPAGVFNSAVVGDFNVISGNAGDGVRLYALDPLGLNCDVGSGLVVELNAIGVSADGAQPLVNGGVPIRVEQRGFAGVVLLIQNLIAAANGISAIPVAPSSVQIAIAENQYLVSAPMSAEFIDLNGDGRTPNDPGDADTGANQLLNYPVISSADVSGPNLTINYGVDVDPMDFPLAVEFYQLSAARAPIQFLGSDVYTGNPIPVVLPAGSMAPGDRIAAISSSITGDTSEIGDSFQLGVCTWNQPGAGNWTNPANWNNCSGGIGPGPGPAGTPGAGDFARIDFGLVTLDVPVSVGGLSLNGGTVLGANDLTITSDFTWNGGELQAPNSAFQVLIDTSAVATFAGGQKTLNGRTLTFNNALTQWTTGLIELGNGAAVDIGAGSILETNPGAAEERFFFNGAGAEPQITNLGSIIKIGPNVSGIGTGINLNSVGSILVQDGVFKMRNRGSAAGSFDIAAGAILDLAANTFNFLSPAVVSGNGELIFGDFGPTPGSYDVASCLGTNGPVSVRNAGLSIGCTSPQAFHELRLQHPNALLQGSANMQVLFAMEWQNGTILGTGAPAATLTLNPTATAVWPDPSFPGHRVLDSRDLINQGAVADIASANETRLANNARVINAPAAIFDLNITGGIGNWRAVGTGSPAFVNQGTLNVLGSGTWAFTAGFTNDGLVSMTGATQLYLQSSGSDSGDYLLDSSTQLYIDGSAGPTARTFGGSGGVSGDGALLVSNGGKLTVTAPTYAVRYTSISGSPGTVLELSTGATVTVAEMYLQGGGGGTLTGTSPIDVTSTFEHRSGLITSTSGTPALTLSGSGQFTSAADKFIRQRALTIGGAVGWDAGNIELDQGASIAVTPGASWNIAHPGVDAQIRCTAGCTSSISNAGSISKGGLNVIGINPAIVFNQSGLLSVDSGTLTLPAGFTQTSGTTGISTAAAVLDLAGASLTVSGGILSGRGQINGDVLMLGGVLRPGGAASTDTLTINGGYSQGVAASLEIEIGVGFLPIAPKPSPAPAGPSPFANDLLSISGSATLAGNVSFINLGYALSPPETVNFLTAGAGVSGAFDTFNNPYAGYLLFYNATSVALGPLPPLVDPIVNSVADPGDGICDLSECTLREAINGVNATPAADLISFNIPGAQCVGAGGACVIQPATPLPPLVTPIAIDGYTQPGASANTLTPDLGLGSDAVIKIELDGSLSAGFGLDIAAPGAPVSVEGLAIHDFDIGVAVSDPPSLQNGVAVPGSTNSVVSNDDFAEFLVSLPPGASNLTIDTTGSTGDLDLYVRFGLAPTLNSFDCRPFTGSGDENCTFSIPGAGVYYIRVYGFDSGPLTFSITANWTGAAAVPSQVTLGGSFLGLRADGSLAAGAQFKGIEYFGSVLQVGDGSARGMNVLSGNSIAGLAIVDGSQPGNSINIQGNLIGTAPDGSGDRGNLNGILALSSTHVPGISIGGNSATLGNVIGHNGTGVLLDCNALSDICFNGLQILGNYIGTNPGGGNIGNLGNGVTIANMTGGNVVIGSPTPAEANVIRNNGGQGIATGAVIGTGIASFLINQFGGNAGLAIDLAGDGPTANDPGDADGGPNNLQNYPDISSYVLDPGGTGAALSWSIDTPDDATNYPMRVDFYRAAGDEIGIWLGSASCVVAAPSTCSANLIFPGSVVLTANDRIAAIATDNQGRSSEVGTLALVDPVVNSVLDPGDGVCDPAECTLREAIDAANLTPLPDLITFDPAVFSVPSKILLTAGELLPTQDLGILGPGVDLLTVSGNDSSRILQSSGINLQIAQMTLTGGNGTGASPDFGGAINQIGGSLGLTDVALVGNQCPPATGVGGAVASVGGSLAVLRSTVATNVCDNVSAIYLQDGDATINDTTLSDNSGSDGEALRVNATGSDSVVFMTNATISGNSTSSSNSAIRSDPGVGRIATITLTNSTVSGNSTSAPAGNGAIWLRPAGGTHLFVLNNSIVAGNTVAGLPNDIEGNVDASSAFNLIGTGGGLVDGVNGNQVGINNPLLAPLANYGGPTATRALLPGSAAIDAGDMATAPPVDQRGVARPQLGNADIGAFESQGFVLSLLSGSPQSAALNTTFAAPLAAGIVANDPGEPVDGGEITFSAPLSGASASLLSSPASIASGTANVSATAIGAVGNYLVSASASGASGTADFSLNNQPAATTIAISDIAPTVSVAGQPYTVTVAVSDAMGTVVDGSVSVTQLNDGANCVIVLAASSSCQLVATSAITTAVRAVYSGSPDLAPSMSGTVIHVVDRADTAIQIVDDTPDPSAAGASIQVTVRLDVLAPGAGTPGGEILITDGSASCGISLPNLSCEFVPKALGLATLEARYLGDANFKPSVDTEAHTISSDGADLSIIKRNGLRLLPGGAITSYILLVSNAGPQDVVNARVSDILPAQLSNASWTCTPGDGASCPPSGIGTVDTLVNLAAGSSLSFELSVSVQINPEQVVSNRATVTPPANAPDPNIENNESIDTDLIGILGDGFETESE
jgi:uncharacterized repeat protein (TIGR01451 family)/CSLREA domain-containing protein